MNKHFICPNCAEVAEYSAQVPLLIVCPNCLYSFAPDWFEQLDVFHPKESLQGFALDIAISCKLGWTIQPTHELLDPASNRFRWLQVGFQMNDLYGNSIADWRHGMVEGGRVERVQMWKSLVPHWSRDLATCMALPLWEDFGILRKDKSLRVRLGPKTLDAANIKVATKYLARLWLTWANEQYPDKTVSTDDLERWEFQWPRKY